MSDNFLKCQNEIKCDQKTVKCLECCTRIEDRLFELFDFAWAYVHSDSRNDDVYSLYSVYLPYVFEIFNWTAVNWYRSNSLFEEGPFEWSDRAIRMISMAFMSHVANDKSYDLNVLKIVNEYGYMLNYIQNCKMKGVKLHLASNKQWYERLREKYFCNLEIKVGQDCVLEPIFGQDVAYEIKGYLDSISPSWDCGAFLDDPPKMPDL